MCVGEPYLKQGHVLAVILLALLCGSIAAVDEGTALLRVAVTWKKRPFLDWREETPTEGRRQDSSCQRNSFVSMSEELL